MKRLLLPVAALAALVLAPLARAESVRKTWIHEKATWVLHVDVQALVGSRLGGFVLAHPEIIDLNLRDLENIHRETGVDVLHDIRTATIYGAESPDKQAVILLTMNDSIDGLLERLTEQPEHIRMEQDGLVFHGWEENGEVTMVHVRPGATPEDRIVLVSRDARLVREAARVLDGRVGSQADRSHRSMELAPVRGSLVYAEAIEMPWLEKGDDPASAVVRRSDHLCFDLAETGETMSAQLRVSAFDGDDATDIAEVLQGLVAMGRIVAGEEPALTPLVRLSRDLKMTAKGNDVVAHLECPTETVIGLLGKAVEASEQGHDDE